MVSKLFIPVSLFLLFFSCKENSGAHSSISSLQNKKEIFNEKTDGNSLALLGEAESCMKCHNGSTANDYKGQGLKNPHPFGGDLMTCTKCHGGNPAGTTAETAHVPPPPQIGNWRQITANQVANNEASARAEFNRRTLAGIDTFDIENPGGYFNINGVGAENNGGNAAADKYYAIDYLIFINPGDLRVVTKGKGCGECHAQKHGEWTANSVIATETGFFSGTDFMLGMDSTSLDGSVFHPLYANSGSEFGFRARIDAGFKGRDLTVGFVPELKQNPVYDKFGDNTGIFQNNAYLIGNIAKTSFDGDKRTIPNSPFANIAKAAVDSACGDCHLGSAGANNRFADFRSSGCTSCHMQYGMDGRSKSTDPYINKTEPANPDAIAPGERAHPIDHEIRNVAKLGVKGIQDETCVGCHQGSNRTVLQYWGIRLDQNQDVVNNFQYPSNPNPKFFANTGNNSRLFDQTVGNNTFNGRNENQYLEVEDYDFDNRDDTPADVHFEAGMGCIDCHGSRDLHNGTEGDETSGALASRKSQSVKIQCESCHGAANEYAKTKPCETFFGVKSDCAVDKEGNTLKHIVKDAEGEFWLTSKLTGKKHYVTQTLDVIVDNNKVNPVTKEPIHTAKGSFAMGRADGKEETGMGPHQANGKVGDGFSHMDNMTCASCHSAWVNNCIGCHIESTYNENAFTYSNISGERTVTSVTNATFAYISPVPFYLGVNASGKISQNSTGMKVFMRYKDRQGNLSNSLTASSYLKEGNNGGVGGRDVHAGLGYDMTSAHSIRGRVTENKEGVRYCVSCHLTKEGLDTNRQLYDNFRNALANRNYDQLDFNVLKQHIGQNPGNQLNSPLWVHMVAGLGSGLFLFDAQGCPVNPLDNNANRFYCNQAPSQRFNNKKFTEVKFNLDGMVEANGVSNVASIHPMFENIGTGSALRDGAYDAIMAGPLGKTLIEKLTDPNTGIVLDSWLSSDGTWKGQYQQILNSDK